MQTTSLAFLKSIHRPPFPGLRPLPVFATRTRHTKEDALFILARVRESVPFLFENAPQSEYRTILLDAEKKLAQGGSFDLDAEEFFQICLASYWATAGSLLPAEVDSWVSTQIWRESLPFSALEGMADLVLRAGRWDDSAVSNRWVSSPVARSSLDHVSTHQGKWFSVAVAAYAATRERAPTLAIQIREALEFEVTRQAKVYLEIRKAKDGLSLLVAAAIITQNLTELDRALEIWEIDGSDPLTDFAYQAGRDEGSRAARFAGALSEANRLNFAQMRFEHHRHLSLRGFRCLRRARDFLVPFSPFLDEWGTRMGRSELLTTDEVGLVLEALYEGWEEARKAEGGTITHAYPRAFAGILAGLSSERAKLLAPRIERILKASLFRSLVSVPRERFEDQWSKNAVCYARS